MFCLRPTLLKLTHTLGWVISYRVGIIYLRNIYLEKGAVNSILYRILYPKRVSCPMILYFRQKKKSILIGS